MRITVALLGMTLLSARADAQAPGVSEDGGGVVPLAAGAKADVESGGQYASSHGLKMYYEVHGQGEPLLLLHGGLCSIPVWPEALAYFSKHYKVIAMEQMGHGRTADNPARVMSYHDMAEDTFELLRLLNVSQVYVLGWSDGGDVGLDLAIHHPAMVRKLAVSGANYTPSPPPPPGGRSKPLAETVPAFIREPYERLSPDGLAHWAPLVERLEAMWISQPNFSTAELGSISAPTLVIAGDHDFLPPEYNVGLWKHIPRAQLWIAPNSTHGFPKLKADVFNDTVQTFFSEPISSAHPKH